MVTMNTKKGARFLNPVLCSPWESRAPKLYLTTQRIDGHKNFEETSANSSTVIKAEVISPEIAYTSENASQRRTIVNAINSTSTCAPHDYVALQNVQWLNTQNQNVNLQCNSANIRNATSLQNKLNCSVPFRSVFLSEETAAFHHGKDRQLVKLYTPGNSNFRCAVISNSNVNSSTESINSSISGCCTQSSVGHYNFPKRETPAISPGSSQNYIYHQWNSHEATNEPNTTPNFSVASNTTFRGPSVQSSEFCVPGNGSERSVNSGNIPALQPFTDYTWRCDTSLLRNQDDVRNAAVPSTFSNRGFVQNKEANNQLEERPVSWAWARNSSHKHMFPKGFLPPNIPNAITKPNEVHRLKEDGSSVKDITLRGIEVKTPHQTQINRPSTNNHMETKRLMQEEEPNSTMAMEFFHELRDLLQNTGNERDVSEVEERVENRKRKLQVFKENVTGPADYDEFSGKAGELEIRKSARAIPTVNVDQIAGEFINCSYEEFDIDENGDIEFPNEETAADVSSCNISQDVLGSLRTSNNASQISQAERELEETKSKVGIVLKKKNRGYQSSLL